MTSASIDIDPDTLEGNRHVMVDDGTLAVAVRRVDPFGQPGFLLSVERMKLVDLWRQLTLAGVRPGGAQAFHARRIESGLPLCGLDLTAENLAPEAARTQGSPNICAYSAGKSPSSYSSSNQAS